MDEIFTEEGGSADVEIHHKSCEAMAELAAESVHLTLTSPPYWNAIDYDTHAEDGEARYREREYGQAGDTYEGYLEHMQNIFSEVYRLTAPGGFLAVNVSTLLHEQKHYPLPFDLLNRLTGSGWEFFQDIIWNKTISKSKRGGVYIQQQKFGYFYANFIHEYVLVLRKPGPKRRGTETETGIPIDKLYTQDICHTVWHIAPVPPNQLQHPCPFPAELARRVVLLWSARGDTVLDPFMGSGTTALTANQNGRNFIGYETEESYIEFARNRLVNPETRRKFNLIPVYEKIETD